MFNTCIGNPQTYTLYACLQGLVDCKNGPIEISKGEACARWEDN